MLWFMGRYVLPRSPNTPWYCITSSLSFVGKTGYIYLPIPMRAPCSGCLMDCELPCSQYQVTYYETTLLFVHVVQVASLEYRPSFKDLTSLSLIACLILALICHSQERELTKIASPKPLFTCLELRWFVKHPLFLSPSVQAGAAVQTDEIPLQGYFIVQTPPKI